MHGPERKVHGSSALSAALKQPQPQEPPPCATPDPRVHQAHTEALDWRAPPPSPSSTASAASLRVPGARLPRVILPFWSCFGGASGSLDSWQVRQHTAHAASAVSAEVGIRPSFYWLTASVSEEERLCAEANARWMKADCQDDAVVLRNFADVPSQIFAGVFDGHGPWGRSAAKYASTLIPRQLAAASAMGAGKGGDKKRLRAMRDACASVDADMRDADTCGFDASLSGTTACFAVVQGRKLYLANAGDSRCVLARRSASGGVEAVQMTWDAKPDHPEELKRIQLAGGVVQQLLDESGERVGSHRVFRKGDDVLPGLAMSRSLGDLYAHAVGVTSEPVLSSYTLGERDLFLVLGTDGLWDIMSNEEVVDFVQRYRNSPTELTCAEALTLEAQERWKARHEEALVDDISVAIIHTAPLPTVDRSARVRSPLAHAACCNDEANDLTRAWAVDVERNPSHHPPANYFPHLYRPGESPAAASGAGAAPAPPPRRLLSEGAALAAERAAGLLPPRSPRGPARSISLPATPGGGGDGAGAAAPEEEPWLEAATPQSPAPLVLLEPQALLPPPHAQLQPGQPLHPPAQPLSPTPMDLPSPHAGATALSGRAGAEENELSPRSSLECSEGESASLSRLGSRQYSGVFARAPLSPARPTAAMTLQQLGAVRSSPIPCSPADYNPLLRPIRKAYPSQSGGLCSYKSDASLVNSALDTPCSTEGGDSRGSGQSRNFAAAEGGYEGKLRGGLPRTTSAPILAQSLRWQSCSSEAVLSCSMHAVSVDERLGHLAASCSLADSPTDSSLSSPYRAFHQSMLSPVGPPMVGPPPPYALPPAFKPAGGRRNGGGGGAAPAPLEPPAFGFSTRGAVVRSASEAPVGGPQAAGRAVTVAQQEVQVALPSVVGRR